MSTSLSLTELQKMSPDELRRDLRIKRAECSRMRLNLEVQSEKNHALYRSMKRDCARMTMVLDSLSAKTAPQKKSSGKASQKAEKPVKDSGTLSKKK